MAEIVSLLDVIKRGGYEASLITTFNATLPYYEEVVLRKLVAAGCRHNVVLMDHRQCAVAWGSEATRPRLAGHAYTLLPIRVPGAFHPKVCLLLGPKKASILVGSHNLTLSGLGFNREVSNWIEVAGAKDGEGAALLAAIWAGVKEWLERARSDAPEPLLESALALSRYVVPLIVNAGAMTSTALLLQNPGGATLFEQLTERVPKTVRRIAVLGPFFDLHLEFLKQLQQQWPNAELVVGLDPDTVQHPGSVATAPLHYVDVRGHWDGRGGYLHAKVLYFEAERTADDVLVSGSANPSRPAWLARSDDGNAEAMVLRSGAGVRQVAEDMGLRRLFGQPALAPDALAAISRSAPQHSDEVSALPVWLGYSMADDLIRIHGRRGDANQLSVVLLDAYDREFENVVPCSLQQDYFDVRITVDPAAVRSGLVYENGLLRARVMVQHPALLLESSRSSRQAEIRAALNELGSDGADIANVIAMVQRVIFSDQTEKEVALSIRERAERSQQKVSVAPLESLAISPDALPRERRKAALLKSGDIAYLLDVLVRRLGVGLEGSTTSTDRSGRSEEEQIDQDDDELPDIPVATTMETDEKIAQAVSSRSKTLCLRMTEQLKAAAKDSSRAVGVLVQLVAVLALLRELRHLEKHPRWRRSGLRLVGEAPRQQLLDRSIHYLLGSDTSLLKVVDELAGGACDESMHLRALLLWLAWDLGLALSPDAGRLLDINERNRQLQANALFLVLAPPVASDTALEVALSESVYRTCRDTPAAIGHATQWLKQHMDFGAAWASGFHQVETLQVGGFCCVPGVIDEPRVVIEIDSGRVGVWDFDQRRMLMLDRVRPVGAGVSA